MARRWRRGPFYRYIVVAKIGQRASAYAAAPPGTNDRDPSTAPRSASRRRGRLAVIAAPALVLAAIVAVVAIVTSGSRPSRQTVISPALLARDRALALGAVNAFSYRGGIWMPAQYTGPAWEKYQTAAAADAVLGLQRYGRPTGGGSADRRRSDCQPSASKRRLRQRHGIQRSGQRRRRVLGRGGGSFIDLRFDTG